MARTFTRSPLALAILALLQEAPMHPYHMQRLIKARGKDIVINVGQRASLYQTIGHLLRAGLIDFWETERKEGYPERTLYRITDRGREVAAQWMREMLATPAQEYPHFPAAISLLPLLTPKDAQRQLEIREANLEKRIASMDEEVQSPSDIPRLFLLETEYMRTVLEAELEWVRGIISDLRDGSLSWGGEWAHPSGPPQTGEEAVADSAAAPDIGRSEREDG